MQIRATRNRHKELSRAIGLFRLYSVTRDFYIQMRERIRKDAEWYLKEIRQTQAKYDDKMAQCRALTRRSQRTLI